MYVTIQSAKHDALMQPLGSSAPLPSSWRKMAGCFSRNEVVIQPHENGFLGPAVVLDEPAVDKTWPARKKKWNWLGYMMRQWLQHCYTSTTVDTAGLQGKTAIARTHGKRDLGRISLYFTTRISFLQLGSSHKSARCWDARILCQP